MLCESETRHYHYQGWKSSIFLNYDADFDIPNWVFDMVQPVFDLYRVIQIAIVITGLVIVYYSYRGYRRTRSRSLLYLALGFVFVAIGSAVSGLLFELLNYSLIQVEIVQSVTRLVGFLLIVYSIIGPRK